MSGGVRRALADLVCRGLQISLPRSLQSWGSAIRQETAGIPDDTQALCFALDSLRGLMPRIILSTLLHPFAWLGGDKAAFGDGAISTSIRDFTARRPRFVGISCMVGAVLLGAIYLALAAAPARYVIINIGASVIGLIALALLARVRPAGPWRIDATMIAMAAALLATAVLAEQIDGAARWVVLGGFGFQPSYVLLPVTVALFARHRGVAATTAMVTIAVALALQPDPAMAGMLALGLVVMTAMRPDRFVVTSCGASIVGFAATLVRAHGMSTAPFVDQILYSSFNVHPVAGIAVVGGAILILVPAIVGWLQDPANRVIYAAFGAVWLAGIVAAAFGNYPTPIIGYGASAIIGYALALSTLPKFIETKAAAATPQYRETGPAAFDRHLLIGLA